jgi:hypothetical protein
MSSAWLDGAKFVATGIGGGGVVAFVQAFAGRRVAKADAAERLTGSALEIAEELKKDAKDARAEAAGARSEAAGARREATEAHNQMRQIRVEAEDLAGRLRMLVAAIWSPTASIDGLRALVPQGLGPNGLRGWARDEGAGAAFHDQPDAE